MVHDNGNDFDVAVNELLELVDRQRNGSPKDLTGGGRVAF